MPFSLAADAARSARSAPRASESLSPAPNPISVIAAIVIVSLSTWRRGRGSSYAGRGGSSAALCARSWRGGGHRPGGVGARLRQNVRPQQRLIALDIDLDVGGAGELR